MNLNSRILSDITVWSKYARFNPNLNRRETWLEIVLRNAEMHVKKYPHMTDEIWDAYTYVHDKTVVPSMRSAQFAGRPIEMAPNRIYNCAFMQMRDYKAFSEIMFLLLGGSGVGCSVQKAHIKQLPSICPPKGEARYMVQDSQVGWSDAVKNLMKAYFFGKPKPIFDFRDVRIKGTPLKTSGGVAPGPEPLKRGLENIERILLTKAYGSHLTPLEVTDIICHLAECVLSGGIRRAATIVLFDYSDTAMLNAKAGEWWISNPQRAMANLSAVLDRRKLTYESFSHVFDITRFSGSGEPGFFLTNDPEWGCNPCGEIALQDCGLCNLTEVNVDGIHSQEEFNSRCRAAAIIGTLQAGYTDFWYLRPEWEQRAKQEALLGVSLTGLAGFDTFNISLSEGAAVVAETNKEIARKIGINPANRLTTVKPSGTTSLVLGTSAGIHAWYAPYYIRRMQLSKNEPLEAVVKAALPSLVEDHYLRPEDTSVLSIPIKAPDNAKFRDEGALSTLSRVIRVTENWIGTGHIKGLNHHNVSCTINVKPEEWDAVKQWMWEYRGYYSGISLLPYDNGTYKQAPYEEITQEQYEELSKHLTDFDIAQLARETSDNTDLVGEIACSANGCAI